mgnify:CR=1 FL=1
MEIKTWQDIVNRCKEEVINNASFEALDNEYNNKHTSLFEASLETIVRRAVHTWQSALRDVPIGSELMSVLLPGMSES